MLTDGEEEEGQPQNESTRIQSSSVQSYPTLCDPTDCNTVGLLVHHQLLAEQGDRLKLLSSALDGE